MRIVLSGDWHLESGTHLGLADLDHGSTRLVDAERVLGEICSEPCDAFIFLGDLARNARPGPTALRIAQDALKKVQAPVVMVHGNHDHTGEATSALHVVSKALPTAKVFQRPQLIQIKGVQIGILPWTPPNRMFDKAGHDPHELSRIVAEKLLDVARGMGSKLDPSKPAILVGHWLVMDQNLPSGQSVMEVQEPLMRSEDLEATGPWDQIVFGHNHLHQRMGTRCWSCGPPMRGSFGEAEAPTGFMVVEWGKGERPGVAKFEATDDRRLVTLTPKAEDLLQGMDPGFLVPADLGGAIVRVKLTATEEQARALSASGRLRQYVDALYDGGAMKVVGPQVTVHRERRVRSDLTVDTDPVKALEAYLVQREVPEALRARVLREHDRITS